MFGRKRKPTLDVLVVERGDVIQSYSTVADSDLELGMFAGSLRKFETADVVVLKNNDHLTILKSRLPADDLIERIRG